MPFPSIHTWIRASRKPKTTPARRITNPRNNICRCQLFRGSVDSSFGLLPLPPRQLYCSLRLSSGHHSMFPRCSFLTKTTACNKQKFGDWTVGTDVITCGEASYISFMTEKPLNCRGHIEDSPHVCIGVLVHQMNSKRHSGHQRYP